MNRRQSPPKSSKAKPKSVVKKLLTTRFAKASRKTSKRTSKGIGLWARAAQGG